LRHNAPTRRYSDPVVRATPPPGDVPGLLRRLMAEDPGRPRLTWYGADERVELSAKVLDNWVAKTANLLVDELDAGPGSRIVLALPAHWRTVTWLLAVWATGACAVLPAGGSAPVPAGDVVVSDDVEVLEAAGRAVPVGVALPALALAFGAGLPPGAVDAASGVRSHGDVFVPLVPPVADDPALVIGAETLLHGDLLAAAERAADAAGWPAGVRLLSDGDPRRAVAEVLGPLVRSGSVVVHHALAGLDAAARTTLTTQEAITTHP